MQQRRLAAIMFTDIVGYTILMGTDEDRAFEVLSKNREIELCQDAIETEDLSASWGFVYYDLFATYAFLEDYDKAFEYLQKLEEEDFYPSWLMSYFKFDPLLDKVREYPRFKDFLLEVDIKFQREHNRLQAWLEEEGILQKGEILF